MRPEIPGRYKPYSAYKDSGVEWLGKIPAHWEVKRWRYCCHVTEGQVAPDDETYSDRVMIAPNHIESGTGRILFTETAQEQGAISGKYVVKPGDIVYSKIRPALNKACIAAGDWLCSADMYLFLVKTRSGLVSWRSNAAAAPDWWASASSSRRAAIGFEP